MGSSIQSDTVSFDGTLEEALEYVVKILESDEALDRDGLLSRFPRWANELNQFIDNWLAMEQCTAQLIESQPNPIAVSAQRDYGTIVGDYELLDLVNTGGMGVVYRARQISLGRIVALKMVLNSVRDKTRFRIEAEASASLHHANIVAIHEVGEFEGQPFLSMQFISGGNLQDHLKSGPMAPRAAAVLVRTIANAVHYAHQRGILHRDLKPANVLLDADRRPFVSDFGLAKQMGNSVELTRSGAIIGTPGYMAPEQAMGQVKSITVAADVYGLGAILYAALTGEAPFRTDSDLLTLRKVIEESPVSPRVKRPELDRNLETICLKCLEKSPAARYGSARQLVDDLTRYLQGEPVTARPIGFVERRWRWCVRNPALAIISFLAGLLLTCVVLLSLGMAWREYNARLDAKFVSFREAAMSEAVELARVNAESKSQEALEAISELYTTNGLWAARTDLSGESLLWFAQAARLTGIPDATIADSKTRCLSWLSHSPKPIAAFELSSSMHAATFQADWSNWQLSCRLPEVMFKTNEEFGIWNFETDDVWRPIGEDFLVRSAQWNKDCAILALGGENGELRLVDAFTKASKAVASFDSPITNIAFSSSGEKVMACMSKKLTMLGAGNLTAEHEWATDAPCIGVKFSADDSMILVATTDGSVSVYRVTGPSPELLMQTQCIFSKKTPFASAFMPEFTKDGKRVLVRADEQRTHFVDIATAKPIGRPMLTGSTHCVAFSPDQLHCASGGDGYARVQSIKWNSDEPSFVRHDCRLTHNDAVTHVVFGGEQFIATSGRDRVVQIWNTGEEKRPGGLINERAIPLASLIHTANVLGMLFSSDGRQLVTLQADGIVRVWEVPTFEPPGYVIRGARGGSTIKPVGEDRWLIAGATHWGNNMVNASLRRLKDGVVVAETPLNSLDDRGHLLDAALTSDQSRLISLHAGRARSSATMVAPNGTAGSIQVWKFPDARPLGTPIPLNAEPRSVLVHPKGEFAAVLLVNMDIVLVDLEKATILSTLSSSRGDQPLDEDTALKPSYFQNGQLQFSPDGEILYAWGIGRGFTVWDWVNKQLKYSTSFADSWNVHHLAVSPTGKQYVVADHSGKRLCFIDSSAGQVIRSIDHLATIRSLEYSPTGSTVLSSCEDGRARIVDVLDESSKSIDLVHNKPILDATFSADGLSIATLTNEMQVYLWRVRNRQWALRPISVPKGTQQLLFSPDSRYLITMGVSQDFRVLNLGQFDGTADLDLDSVTMLGELLSAKAIENGGIVQLSTAEWLERWQTYQSRP